MTSRRVSTRPIKIIYAALLSFVIQNASVSGQSVPELRFKGIYLTPPFSEPIWTSAIPGPGPLYLTALSVSHDGGWVASASPVLHLHDARTGEMITSFDTGTNGEIGTKIMFTPDDKQILSLAMNNVLLWDRETKKIVRRFGGNLGGYLDAALSPDGKALLTGAPGHATTLWDVKTGEILFRYTGATNGASAVAISPDGHFAACGDSRTIRVWRLADGSDLKVRTVGPYDLEQRQNVEDYIRHRARRLEFAKGSNQLLCVGTYSACVWDWQSDKVVAQLHSGQIIGQVIIDPSGTYAIAGQGDYLNVWHLGTGDLAASFCHVERQLPNDFALVLGVACSPDGQTLYSGSTPTIKAWSLKPALSRKPDAMRGSLLAINRDAGVGLSIVAGRFRLWDLRTRSLLPTELASRKDLNIQPDDQVVPDAERRSLGACFFTNKKPFAVVTGPQAELWALDEVKMVSKMGSSLSALSEVLQQTNSNRFREYVSLSSNVFPSKINGCAVLPADAKTLIVCNGDMADYTSIDDNLSAWSLVTGRRLRTFRGPRGGVFDISLSREPNRLLVGGFDKDVRIWDATTGELVTALPSGNFVPPGESSTECFYHVALSDDARFAAAVHSSGLVFVWDAKSAKLLAPPLKFDTGEFNLAFDPNARQLAVAAGTGIFLYSIPSLQRTAILTGHQDYVRRLTFLDSKTIVSSDGDTIRFWPLNTIPAVKVAK